MTKTVVGFLRHGQTDWNIDFRLQGVTDVPLNQTGIAQAELAAQALDASEWDVVLTSPLSRARDTASIVIATTGLPEAVVEPLLLERSFGEAEGLNHDEWRAAYPDSNEVPGGESIEVLEARVLRLLDELLVNFAGQRVLAVSHGALIRKALGILSQGQFPREGERLSNASLSVFVNDATGWQIQSYEPGVLAPKPD